MKRKAQNETRWFDEEGCTFCSFHWPGAFRLYGVCPWGGGITTGNEYLLAVTHGGWPNPAGLPRSTMQRSVYMLQDDRLMRIYNTVLDATYSNNAITTEILNGVVSLEFRVIQDSLDTSTQWPPLGAQGSSAMIARPRAVEIILTLEDEGEIRRIIEVAS